MFSRQISLKQDKFNKAKSWMVKMLVIFKFCIEFITLQFLPKITGQFYLLAKA